MAIMSTLVSGRSLEDLSRKLDHHAAVGNTVQLIVGIDRDLSEIELDQLQNHIVDQGGLQLTAPIEFGSTDEWPNAVRISYVRTSYDGIGFLPLPILLFGGLALMGASLIGWQFTQMIGQGIKDNIVPITLALVVGGVSIYYLSRRVPQAY